MPGDFAACGRRVTLPAAARRRKVRLSPFPPDGENCDRSLAPPLPGEPAALGFTGSNDGLGKTPLGDAADGHFVPIGPLTPSPPLRGTRTGRFQENFRRAKSEWPSKFLPPHWGLAKRKIKAGAISVLRLALPSSRLLSLGVGAAHRAAQFRYEIGPIARRGRCPHRPVAGCATGETDRF